MGGTAITIGPLLAVVLVLLTVIAWAVARWGQLGVARAVVTAAARAVLQLGVVSLVIVAVLRSGWLTAGFVLLMYAIAALTSARRITAGRSGLLAALPIAAGAVPVLALILGTGLVPFRPIAVVPVAGILLGGAMTATSLAGRRALDELRARHGEYEARLALGFTNREARRDVVRTTAAQALVPALDQTRTVGLVTLPGAFVGVLLGSGDPTQAGAAQVLVLIGLLAVETIAVVTVIGLISAGLLERPG